MSEKMSGTLSVVVPVYNAEDYLRRTLESILGQTYPVHEVICVDDGSTDKSGDILDKYAKKYSRVKVLHQENRGSVSARKAGVQRAGGAYTTYVDADDFIELHMYEEMMRLALEHQADLVTSGLVRDYGKHLTVNHEKIAKGVYTGSDVESGILSALIDRRAFFRTGIQFSQCNKIFRTDILKTVQMKVDDRISVGDDAAVVYPFLFRCSRVVVSGESYYHYCLRETGSILGSKKADDYERLQVYFEYLEKEFLAADKPGIGLMKQLELFKAYGLLLRFPEKTIRYDGETLYPFGKIKKEDKILLYGAGKFGAALKACLEKEGFLVVGWMDKSAHREGILRPDVIGDTAYDVVMISVLVADVVQQIYEDLKRLGVPEKKILYVDAEIIQKA